MYYKIEPTGCCERKGYVQIRYAFYLDEGDYGYENHFVDVPIIPKDFDFERKEEEVSADIKKLPTKKQLNPFHNHFCYFPHDTTDKEIQEAGDKFLAEAYVFWSKGKFPNVKNAPLTEKVITNELKTACEQRVSEIKLWQ